MKLHAVRASLTLGYGVKAILSTTGPLQGIFDRPAITHEFCNRQALQILHRDGLTNCAAFFQRYLPELNAGVYWADADWKNVGHYLEPKSRKGLWRFPNAVSEFRCYFGQALQEVRRGNTARAVFFVGAAAHLVQDLCVPHHARAKLLSGHKQYEGWVREQYNNFAVDSGGIYLGKQPAHLALVKNAMVAADFLSMVEVDAKEAMYYKATKILLPRAQQTTSGLFEQFYAAVGASLRAA